MLEQNDRAREMLLWIAQLPVQPRRDIITSMFAEYAVGDATGVDALIAVTGIALAENLDLTLGTSKAIVILLALNETVPAGVWAAIFLGAVEMGWELRGLHDSRGGQGLDRQPHTASD